MRRAIMIVGVLGQWLYSASVRAQSEMPPQEATIRDHKLELVGEVGPAWPRGSEPASSQSMGSNIVASVLHPLGWGWSFGLFVDWTRLPWTPNAGPKAYVDTLLVGPEIRLSVNRRRLIIPHAYLGLGGGGIYPSRSSPTSGIDGGLGLRCGIGLDVRVLSRLRLGVSAGLVAMGGSYGGALVYIPGDPGIPTGAGNVWTMRFGAQGEIF